MDTHYTYFLILAASIACPLALSFDKKVAFYKNWYALFPALLFPAIFYIIWDIFFTYKGVWKFSRDHVTGLQLVNLPIEEVLFFVVVPYCCLFIYECVRIYFPALKNKRFADIFLQLLSAGLLVTGIIFHDSSYTSWTFIFTAVFIAMLYLMRKHFTAFDAVSFLISYAVILIPFLIVNGFLTAIPVVIYNDDENLSIRIYTIPFEDVFYGMLLVMMNVVIYEKVKQPTMLLEVHKH